MDSGGRPFASHQGQGNHSLYQSQFLGSFAQPFADDHYHHQSHHHDLAPGLDPDLQDPFPSSHPPHPADPPHSRVGRARADTSEYEESGSEEDEHSDDSEDAAEAHTANPPSARTRTQHLPIVFTSDEDDEESNQHPVQSESSPQKAHSGLKIVIRRKKAGISPTEDTAENMVSTRGGRAPDYTEVPIDKDEHFEDEIVNPGSRTASASGSRPTRSSRRNGRSSQDGHESDVSSSTGDESLGKDPAQVARKNVKKARSKKLVYAKGRGNARRPANAGASSATKSRGRARTATNVMGSISSVSLRRPRTRSSSQMPQQGLNAIKIKPTCQPAVHRQRKRKMNRTHSMTFSQVPYRYQLRARPSDKMPCIEIRPKTKKEQGSHTTRCNTRSSEPQPFPDGSPDPLGAEIPPNDARAHSQEDDEDAEGEIDEDEDLPPRRATRGSAASAAVKTTRSGRPTRSTNYMEADDEESNDEDDEGSRASHSGRSRRSGRNKTSKSLSGFVVDDESQEDEDAEYGKARRKPNGRLVRGGQNRVQALAASRRSAAPAKSGRGSNSRRQTDGYEDVDSDDDDDLATGDDDQPVYRLRERTKKVDYSLAAPPPEPLRDGMGRIVRRKSNNRSTANSDANGGAFELDARRAADLGLPHISGAPSGRKGKTGWDALPLSMTGKDYAKAFGDEQDSSDDDIPASRKVPPPLFGGSAGAGLLGGGPTALGGAGANGGANAANDGSARDAFGRIKKGGDALADVDPLGVNMQVDFDSVGGLDGHIQQLKEMVSLPLLYPEVFTRFKVTPPRGVLFHGPPGTGKTLVARALAASCSTTGQQISFFMRKGADCLSKWVGEAERQLRLLFDEARASQPSIIFFDEIDGLAPVRSSKQDQIHASIVSTLLALMDGMDGRGQVVVIGATNRPDSVDPALRRPGRFDREFYFPLPSREARLSIINIHTKSWEPPLSNDFKDKLAEVTKGYGGADLRALCTEAALNAIQRRYPQIYQTTERLLLQPESIKVEAKDFMMSVNKLVPSSARSASSAAAPLADHLKPLLGKAVEDAIAALDKVLPPATKRNPLEEALWEDDPTTIGPTSGVNDDNGFGREMMLQTFESLRIFRPRLIIWGKEGMGQALIGAALLHHLEGYHVQSLDVGALMGDSARTPEAAVVQLFVEAKRHKPSVVYIPGLIHWAHSVSDTVRATTKALLDELAASDPVLLLAIAEGPLSELPPDVVRWFGYLDDNKVEASKPTESQRQSYFEDLLNHVSKPPTEFPDAVPRRRRVLEDLPKAPPRPPRQATAAELQQQVYDDQRTLEHLKYRLGPVLGELRKKFKKFTRDVWDEYNLQNLTDTYDWHKEHGKVIVRLRYNKGFRRRRHSSVDDGFRISGGEAMGQSAQQLGAEEAALPQLNGSGHIGVTSTEAPTAPNGIDTTMAESTTELDGPEPTSAPSQQAQLAIVVHSDEPGVPNIVALNGDLASGVEDNADYDYRDMPIWTMNLERMQRRLYHNGYLTIANFLEDLDKIVSNAEQAQEVDMERMVRAHQMRNLAVVLLEQYIDVNFRLECEAMASRQLAREKDKQRAEEEAKKAIEEARAAGKGPTAVNGAGPPRRPSGERFSARVQGQEPEHRHPVDVGAIERGSGKRSRTSSARNSGIEGGERKRARSALINEVDEMIREQELSTDVHDVGVASQAANEGDTSPSASSNLKATVSAIDPEAGTSERIAIDGASVPGADQVEEQGPMVAKDQSVPPLVHPPFICTPSALDHLRQHLLTSSRLFNIDQLLQLRAACFDAVWKRRTEWNRNGLIEELEALVDKVEKAVRNEAMDLEGSS